MKKQIIKLSSRDSVAVVVEAMAKGTVVTLPEGGTLIALDDIPKSHKIAIVDIPQGEKIYRYGEEIGYATKSIRAGEWVHAHNLDSLDMM